VRRKGDASPLINRMVSAAFRGSVELRDKNFGRDEKCARNQRNQRFRDVCLVFSSHRAGSERLDQTFWQKDTATAVARKERQMLYGCRIKRLRFALRTHQMRGADPELVSVTPPDSVDRISPTSAGPSVGRFGNQTDSQYRQDQTPPSPSSTLDMRSWQFGQSGAGVMRFVSDHLYRVKSSFAPPDGSA
jgi:hypothetical protein